MNKLLLELIPIMKLSSGQRFLIYTRMQAEAEARRLTRLVEHLRFASEHERTTRALESRWSNNSSRTTYQLLLTDIDNLVGYCLSGIRDIAMGHGKDLRCDHPMVERVDGFLAAVFPNGVYAITSLPYADQIMAIEDIVTKLTDELAGTVREFGLTGKVEQLIELAREYRRLVDIDRDDVSYTEVRQARERGQELMREVSAIVLGMYYDSTDPEDVAAREALLEPLVAQLAEQRSKERVHRRCPNDEVDDENGPLDDGDIDNGDVTDAESVAADAVAA